MGKARDWRDLDQPYASEGTDLSRMTFEFFRRDDRYRRDYTSLSSPKSPDGETERADLARRWGLRFRG